MPIAYIGLGSNLGNRAQNLEIAIQLLSDNGEISVCLTSSIYETEPEGYEKQGYFFNCVAQVDTELSPAALLASLKGVEWQMGRRQRERWGPRKIDLDLLLYEKVQIETPELTVPHPLMHKRSFVLVPLSEIAPNALHPLFHTTVDVLLKDLREKIDVEKKVKLYRRSEPKIINA